MRRSEAKSATRLPIPGEYARHDRRLVVAQPIDIRKSGAGAAIGQYPAPEAASSPMTPSATSRQAGGQRAAKASPVRRFAGASATAKVLRPLARRGASSARDTTRRSPALRGSPLQGRILEGGPLEGEALEAPSFGEPLVGRSVMTRDMERSRLRHQPGAVLSRRAPRTGAGNQATAASAGQESPHNRLRSARTGERRVPSSRYAPTVEVTASTSARRYDSRNLSEKCRIVRIGAAR